MKLRILVVLVVFVVTMLSSFMFVNFQCVYAQSMVPFERGPGFSAPAPSSPMNNGGGTSLVPQRATADVATCPKCGAPLWGGPGTPCPNCDESTEGKLPVGGGYWVLVGLAMVYGIFCRHNHGRVKRIKA